MIVAGFFPPSSLAGLEPVTGRTLEGGCLDITAALCVGLCHLNEAYALPGFFGREIFSSHFEKIGMPRFTQEGQGCIQ